MTTPVDPITTVQANSTVATAAAAAKANTTSSLLDPKAFLNLLVAQLQYQDPTNPVDTSSFMNQTATLSQVQSMTSMSNTLTGLADAQQAQAATGLIGKQVTYLDTGGIRTSGVVSSASLSSTGATLTVGTTTLPLSSVLEVTNPPA